MEKTNQQNLVYYSPSEAINPTWNAAAYILNKIIADQNSTPCEKLDAIKTLISVTEDFLNVAQCMDNFIDEDDSNIRRRALPKR